MSKKQAESLSSAEWLVVGVMATIVLTAVGIPLIPPVWSWIGESEHSGGLQVVLGITQAISTVILLYVTHRAETLTREQTLRHDVLTTLPVLHFKDPVQTFVTDPQRPMRITVRFTVQNVGSGVALDARMVISQPHLGSLEDADLVRVFTLLPGESIERYITFRMMSSTGDLYDLDNYLGLVGAWYWNIYNQRLSSVASLEWVTVSPIDTGRWEFESPNYAPEVLDPKRAVPLEDLFSI